MNRCNFSPLISSDDDVQLPRISICGADNESRAVGTNSHVIASEPAGQLMKAAAGEMKNGVTAAAAAAAARRDITGGSFVGRSVERMKSSRSAS